MGKRKITCNNSSCKHHTNGGCDTCITLDGSGKCKSFEKGFAYYFHIVWDALDNKNFIDMVEIRMNPDLKRRDKRRAYRDQKAETNRIGEGMRVTEREICGSFRRAENQKQQIQILTELTCKSKYQIIGILLRNGEKVPKSIENQSYKRLDALDAQIFECEMEYKEIVTALTGENRRKEHGNRIQRHGRTEQEQ